MLFCADAFPTIWSGKCASTTAPRPSCTCTAPTSPCLFPQHGPGKKHHRRIVLEAWQQTIVESAPWAFLRGCIRSDGCVFINRTGRYEYLSYGFANHSSDILDLFESICLAQGCGRAATRGRSGSTVATMSPAFSSTWASNREREPLVLRCLRLWRN